MFSIAGRLARPPPAWPPRPSATARTPLVGPIGQMAATSSFGVSFCGERVLKTAAVPPRKSIEATSESYASINSAPSDRLRLRRVLMTTGVVASDSRGSVAPVLIRNSIGGDMASRNCPWELAIAESWQDRSTNAGLRNYAVFSGYFAESNCIIEKNYAGTNEKY